MDMWVIVQACLIKVTRVCVGPGKPRMSWNISVAFSRTGIPGKKSLSVLESSGNLLNASKKLKCMAESKEN